MSPYWGADFFEFFAIFVSRLFQGAIFPLATDEVQLGVLSACAISCGLLGPFLVLKRMAMFANSLSHTVLLGIIVAFLCVGGASLFHLGPLLIGALVAAFATAFLTQGFVKWFRLSEDASIGLVFTSLFALGIVLVSLFTKDLHLGIEAIMGNSDALVASDLYTALTLAAMNLFFVLVFFRYFQLCSFDSHFAKILGIRSGAIHFFLLFLIAATCIAAFRAVGVLLVLSFLVGPYLTARLFSSRLSILLLLTPLIGIAAAFFGVALSRHILSLYELPLSTGALVSSSIGLFYGLGIGGRKIYLFTQRTQSAILTNNKR